MLDPYAIVKSPIITEKAILLKQFRQYVFEVDTKSNKIEIAQAVNSIFKVKVTDVKTITQKPEHKKFHSKAKVKKMRKKAVVTLAEGHEIDLYENIG